MRALRLVYLAHAFRGPTPWHVAENVRRAERWALEVARCGAFPIIPGAVAHFDGQLDDEFWLTGTLALMRRCDAVFLVPGWRESKGATAECAEATAMGLPVFVGDYGDGSRTLQELAEWARQGVAA